MFITDDIKYIGVNDHKIDLFEGQYVVPNGMAYNSYAIIDDKIAIMDSVDKNFTKEWLDNLKNVLGEKKPTYLIVQHMEPDHSANIMNFLDVYPDTIIVGNDKTFAMMEQFFGKLPKNTLRVKDKEELNLGKHSLTFVFAPMVHWPEVMMTYDSYDKVMFTADAFGKFGALDHEEEWDCEARRYYFGIVGKYGAQVQSLLRTLKPLEIKTICPLHGPVLSENLGHYLGLYDTWSAYRSETDGVAIFYTSVYGHTKDLAYRLYNELKTKTDKPLTIVDLAREDWAEAVEDAFRYSTIVLATTTYNCEIYPFMNQFIDHLISRNFKNKRIGLIENGTWFPMAGKLMKAKFAKSADITFLEPIVTIKSAPTQDNLKQLLELESNILSNN